MMISNKGLNSKVLHQIYGFKLNRFLIETLHPHTSISFIRPELDMN